MVSFDVSYRVDLLNFEAGVSAYEHCWNRENVPRLHHDGWNARLSIFIFTAVRTLISFTLTLNLFWSITWCQDEKTLSCSRSRLRAWNTFNFRFLHGKKVRCCGFYTARKSVHTARKSVLCSKSKSKTRGGLEARRRRARVPLPHFIIIL